nr:phosphotransferase [[Erwinia] mediterraneensis]
MLANIQPAVDPAGSFLPLVGLTGQSGRIDTAAGALLARRQPVMPIPFVDRQREYRVLKKLHRAGLTPSPLAYNAHWLLLPWLAGDTIDTHAFRQQREAVVSRLHQLHRQPLTGYRLQLLPLLQRYWQLCRQRNLRWQRALRRLTRQGEPQPLRLAPVHMDIHPGNVIVAQGELHFIDWEYAADADVALDVAVLCAADPQRQACWIASYARQARLAPAQLEEQVRRWQPWLRLLMASWYQLRAEQQDDRAALQRAAAGWQQF